ncbi:hypothetical protein [Borreliella turdi]|nr:hypothetical protein [Borreliella turdi]
MEYKDESSGFYHFAILNNDRTVIWD